MNVFSKEKDLIHKLANLVLILMLIGSLLALYSSIIDVTYTQKVMPYETYKNSQCIYIMEEEDKTCQEQYEFYKENVKPDIYRKIRIILTTIGTTIIMGTALYLLNKEKDVK